MTCLNGRNNERGMEILELENLSFELVRRPMKSIRLTVKPSDARLCVSAPPYVREAEIRAFLLSRWDWIVRHREQALAVPPRPERQYLSGEHHFCFGEACVLQVEESWMPSVVTGSETEIRMRVKAGTSQEQREALLYGWYRKQLHDRLSVMMEEWCNRLEETGVTWSIRRMRARWGSCCPSRRSILFNLELARMPIPYIEYVVVHELTHLKEASHNARFKALLAESLPEWPRLRKELNAFAVSLEK